MPKRLSAEEKIAKAEATANKAVALKIQGHLEQAKRLLQKHPDLAKDTVEFLEGAIQRKEHGMPQAPEAKKQPESEAWLPQYTKLEVTPTRLLRQILQAMNPIVFSNGNLRSFCAKHQREPPKIPLAECVEFGCGMSMVAIIPPEHRDIVVMKQIARTDYIANGSLAERLQLPPDWSRDGYYIYDDRREAGAGVWVQRQLGAHTDWRRVPRTMTGPIHIADNFSLHRGTLRESTGKEWFLLTMLFPEHAAQPRPPLAELSGGESLGGMESRSGASDIAGRPLPEPVVEPSVESPAAVRRLSPPRLGTQATRHDGVSEVGDGKRRRQASAEGGLPRGSDKTATSVDLGEAAPARKKRKNISPLLRAILKRRNVGVAAPEAHRAEGPAPIAAELPEKGSATSPPVDAGHLTAQKPLSLFSALLKKDIEDIELAFTPPAPGAWD